MAAMTPEQQYAHNALTLPLWAEWEAYCDRTRVLFPRAQDQLEVPLEMTITWITAVHSYGITQPMKWVGPFKENFQLGEDLYVWIP